MIKGFFDCRKFKAGVDRKNREMCGVADKIHFNFEVPESEVEQYGGFAKKVEDINGVRYFVNAKIYPKTCQFFDRYGKIDKPDNAKLDGVKWDAEIRFSVKHGKEQMDSNGVYINGIQLLKEETPFEFEQRDGGDIGAPAPMPDDLPY